MSASLLTLILILGLDLPLTPGSAWLCPRNGLGESPCSGDGAWGGIHCLASEEKAGQGQQGSSVSLLRLFCFSLPSFPFQRKSDSEDGWVLGSGWA